MAWSSILPSSFSEFEATVVRLFVILGLLCLAPWVLLLITDIAFYLCRATTYEIPYVGGRARGKPRPRAPTLTERPNGEKRPFGLISLGEETEDHANTTAQEEPPRPLKRQNTARRKG